MGFSDFLCEILRNTKPEIDQHKPVRQTPISGYAKPGLGYFVFT